MLFVFDFLALFFARIIAEGEGKGERKKIDRATTQCNVEGFLKYRERERDFFYIRGKVYESCIRIVCEIR